MEAIALAMITEVIICEQCKEEMTGDCEGGLCTECCRSNKIMGNFHCCDGGYGSSSDEVAALMEIPGFMKRDGVSGRMNSKAWELLKTEGMAEKQQQNGRNCIFKALSDAAGMGPGRQKDLQRRVIKRILMLKKVSATIESCHDMFKQWNTNKVLMVAAGEMQVRIRVIKMDGDDGEEVEIQTVGENGPVISVALYTKTQHVKALINIWEHMIGADVLEEFPGFEGKWQGKVDSWNAEYRKFVVSFAGFEGDTDSWAYMSLENVLRSQVEISEGEHHPAAAEGEGEVRYRNETSSESSETRCLAWRNKSTGNKSEKKCETRLRRWTAKLQKDEMEAVEDSQLTREYKLEKRQEDGSDMIDDFVVWMCEDGSWMAGIAEDVEEDRLRVKAVAVWSDERAVTIWSDEHGMIDNKEGLWLYMWEEEDGSYRGMERPAGTKSLMMAVSVDLVKMAHTLTETNKLSIFTRERMKSMGILSKQCLKGAVV